MLRNSERNLEFIEYEFKMAFRSPFYVYEYKSLPCCLLLELKQVLYFMRVKKKKTTHIKGTKLVACKSYYTTACCSVVLE